jgi:hypothetical protein
VKTSIKRVKVTACKAWMFAVVAVNVPVLPGVMVSLEAARSSGLPRSDVRSSNV